MAPQSMLVDNNDGEMFPPLVSLAGCLIGSQEFAILQRSCSEANPVFALETIAALLLVARRNVSS